MLRRALVLVGLAACAAPPGPAPVAQAPAVATPVPSAEARLATLAVSDDDFYRPVLYTWTTPDAIDDLERSRQLLVATATSGGFVSPFNRALQRMSVRHGAGRAMARLLLTDPAVIHRRYAWPAPFATVMGLGSRAYGNALIRIELRPEAWIGRFDPAAAEPFRFVDATGAPVAMSDVLATPARLGAIFHVRTDVPVHFREYVVCNEGMVAAWSVATPEIRAEVEVEAALLRDLRDRIGELPAGTWEAALAFYNARYLPDPRRLDAIALVLEAYLHAEAYSLRSDSHSS